MEQVNRGMLTTADRLAVVDEVVVVAAARFFATADTAAATFRVALSLLFNDFKVLNKRNEGGLDDVEFDDL